MKLLGFRPYRGKLKDYLIQKPEEIQNNQSGEDGANCFCFARIVTPFSPLASRFKFDFSPLQQKGAARKPQGNPTIWPKPARCAAPSRIAPFSGGRHTEPCYSVEVKDLVQIFGDGAVVRVRQHQILHISPPASARVRLRDSPPEFLRLDLGVREEPLRPRLMEDGVVAHAVSAQNLLHLRPDGVVPTLVLLAPARLQLQQKRFPNHTSVSVRRVTEAGAKR